MKLTELLEQKGLSPSYTRPADPPAPRGHRPRFVHARGKVKIDCSCGESLPPEAGRDEALSAWRRHVRRGGEDG